MIHLPHLIMRFERSFTIAVTLCWLSMTSADEALGQMCYIGRPKKECRAFIISEVGGYHTSVSYAKPQGHALFEAGPMFNWKENSAIGGTVAIGSDFDRGLWLGLKGRYRYWIARRLGMDVGIGILYQSGDEYGGTFTRMGPTTDVSLSVGDLVGLTVRFDWMQGRRNTGPPVPYTGVKLGSYAGLVGGVIVFIVGAWAHGMSQI